MSQEYFPCSINKLDNFVANNCWEILLIMYFIGLLLAIRAAGVRLDVTTLPGVPMFTDLTCLRSSLWSLNINLI